MERILTFKFHERGWGIQRIFNGHPSLPIMNSDQINSIFYAHDWMLII